MVPVPEDQLPVRLPENIQFSGKGNPLDSHEEFKNCKCPKCNKDAKRETDTMDTFMDSSWYFFRYIDSLNTKEPFSKSLVDKYGPVDLYIGGVEHAILHLLYARFISKFLAKIGKWNGGDLNGEPFTRLVSQGMVHGKTYIHPKTSKFLQPQELDLTDLTNPKLVEVDPSTGEALVPEITYEKMSKSKFNGVDPVECMEKYGADSARAHMLFLAPLDMILLWDESKISGIQRWLKKLVNMNTAIVDRFAAELQKQGFKNSSLDTILSNNETYLKSHEFNESEINLFNTVQQYVGLIDKAFGKDLSMNTAISDYMKLTNTISSEITNGNADINLLFNSYYKLILIVSPVCPAITEELWEILQQKLGISTWTSIFKQHWPEQLPVKESPYTEFSVMINGKFKFKHKALRSLIDKSENEITEEIVRECPNEKDKALLTEGKIKKTIIKPKAICYVLQK